MDRHPWRARWETLHPDNQLARRGGTGFQAGLRPSSKINRFQPLRQERGQRGRLIDNKSIQKRRRAAGSDRLVQNSPQHQRDDLHLKYIRKFGII